MTIDDPDGRVDPPQLAVRRRGLAHRHLGHVEHRHRRVADQLLPDQATRSRRAAARGGERDQQVAERREQERHDDDRPEAARAPRPGWPRAPRAATRTRRAPRRRRSPRDRAGARRSRTAARSAPNTPHIADSPSCPTQAAQDRVVDDEPHALADLVDDRLAVGGRRRRRLRRAGSSRGTARRRRTRRASIRIAIGAVSSWTRKPATPKAKNSIGRGRRQRPVGTRRGRPRDDRGQVGLVGDVEERGQHAGQRRRR